MNLRSKSPHFRAAKYTGFAVISSVPKCEPEAMYGAALHDRIH